MAASPLLTPRFFWAQDKNHLYLRIDLIDVADIKCEVTAESLSFRGTTSGKQYGLNFNFRFPVNAQTAKYSVKRNVEFVIEKESSEAFWPHILTKEDKKKLKNACNIDWNLFVDEDELDEKKMGDNMDFGDFSNLNLGDDDNYEPFNGDDDDEEDSDDEDIPGLESTNDDDKPAEQAAADKDEEPMEDLD